MSLGLLDILTAQQVDSKPQFGGARRMPGKLGGEGISFQDFLNADDAKEINNKAKEKSAFRAEPVRGQELPNTDRQELPSIKPTEKVAADNNAAYTDNNFPAEAAQNDSIPAENAGGENFAASAETSPALSKQITPEQKEQLAVAYNTLKQMQENGQVLSAEALELLKQAQAVLQDNGVVTEIPGADITAQAATNLTQGNPEEALENVLDDVLDTMTFNPEDEENKADVNITQGSQQAIPDITKIAEKVIEVAKESAEKPIVSESDVRVAQTTSLLNLNKKQGKDEENTALKSAIAVDSGEADIITSDEIIAPTQQITENKKADNQISFSSDRLRSLPASDQRITDNTQAYNNSQASQVNIQQNQLAAGQQTTAPQDIIKQVIGEASKENNFSSKLSENNSNLPGITSENFVKFQRIMEEAQSFSKTPHTSRTPHADEVLAQIKFGIGNISSKAEKQISIQLHPRELGKVDIKMDMGADGKTNIIVIAERTDTLNLLQKESASLKDMLTDALKTDSGNLNFSFHEQGNGDWKEFSQNKFTNFGSAGSGDLTIAPEYPVAGSYRSFGVAEGLDIRV